MTPDGIGLVARNDHIPEDFPVRKLPEGMVLEDMKKIEDIMTKFRERIMESHIGGELNITKAELESMLALFERGNELCGNFLDFLEISQLYIVLVDDSGKILAASKSYLRDCGYTRDELVSMVEAGVDVRGMMYHKKVVPGELERVKEAVMRAHLGQGYDFEPFVMATAWMKDGIDLEGKPTRENIKQKAFWTTHSHTQGITLRLGIPEYLLPTTPLALAFNPSMLGGELQKGREGSVDRLSGIDLMDNPAGISKLHTLVHGITMRSASALRGDESTVPATISDITGMIKGMQGMLEVSRNLEGLNEQTAFGVVRYDENNFPVYWSKGMEHHLGYNLQHIQYYLHDWRKFFFGPQGSELRVQTETKVRRYLEGNLNEEDLLPTVYGWSITFEEYLLHAEADRNPSLVNLFYGYSKEVRDGVVEEITKLQPGEGYSEVHFRPRCAGGYPIDTLWTSMGLKQKGRRSGDLRVMRPMIAGKSKSEEQL